MPIITKEEFDAIPGKTRVLTEEEFSQIPEKYGPPPPPLPTPKVVDTAFDEIAAQKRIADTTRSDSPANSYSDEAAAAARGARSGLTLSYDDEIGGGGAAVADYLWNLANSSDKESFGEKYRKYRDDIRVANKKSELEHPYIYGGAKLAGNVTTGLLSGGTSLPAIAGLAAVQSLGESDTDLTEPNLDNYQTAAKDVAIGTAGGVAGGAAGKVLGAAAGKYLAPVAEKLGSKIGSPSGAINSLRQQIQEVSQLENTPETREVLFELNKELTKLLTRQESSAAATAAQDATKSIASNQQGIVGKALKSPVTHTIAGAGLGSVVGGPLGAVAGGAAGYGLPKVLPKVAQKLPTIKANAVDNIGSSLRGASQGIPNLGQTIGGVREASHASKNYGSPADASSKIKQILEKSPQLLGRYGPVLRSAQSRGDDAIGATLYILQQREPEFKKLWNDINNTDQVINADNL